MGEFGGGPGPGGAHGFLEEADLLGEGGRPRLFAAGCGCGFGFNEAGERGGNGDGMGGLVFAPKPADKAGGLFGAVLGIEGDDALEDLLGSEVVRPAVGVEDGAVEVVVNFAQDADEAGVLDVVVLPGELGASA